MGGFIKKIFLCIAIGLMCSGHLYAATVRLNSGGGLNTSDGLHTYVEDTTQIQVRRLNNTGQLYNPNAIPSNTQLDNGIYLRANGALIGPDHFGFPSTLTPTAYINRSVSTPTPATVSQGVTQSTTLQFSAPRLSTLIAGPSVTVNWKYTYPLDYITAEVTIVIPIGYAVSSSNPVRYYHAIDTYLGGSDNGCGVRYVDTNGKQVVGTYPLVSGNCPSSNSLPANLDVVESFRERNGKFDHYCVGFWNTFWTSTSSNACAIGKTASLSDSVTTTYQDTGAAIEYDFTSPGIYTFSYDFVVGSTFVPNYDHLEIRHAGTGTLCPVDVQVLACLSSTVPCPDNQLVATGVLTGNLTVSPNTPTVTATPDSTFSIGSGVPIDTVSITGSAAATYSLGAGNLTKAPLSGVKCWNTTTNSQSCSFTFTNTPCVDSFECMENSQATYNNLKTTPTARNPLNTKVWNMNFDMDIVAVLANGSQSTGYNSASGLIVDLVVDDNNSCGSTVVATQTLPFASTDAGRKKITFTASASNMTNGSYPKGVYPNLRCKVRDLTLNKSGCSSDNFALRPALFTVTSSSSNFTQVSISPTIQSPRKAWMDNFNLTASTGEANYSGTPFIRSDRVFSHASNFTATLGKFGYGVFNPNAIPPYPPETEKFPQAVNGISSGNEFVYGEVGFFRFDQYGVYDETFTAVDNVKGDCNNEPFFNSNGSLNSNSFNSDGIKNGCRFGNNGSTNFFGRFIPDHFRVATGTVAKACSNLFTYYGQDVANTGGVSIPFTIFAENGANGTTQYYNGVPSTSTYAKFVPSTWTNYKFTTTPNLGSGDTLRSAFNPALPTGWTNGQVFVDAKFKIDRPVNQTIPQNVTFSAEIGDSDGTATKPVKIALDSSTQFRYGRLAIPPVHGSELLPLPLRVEAQYWDGASINSYRRSTDDSCTAVLPSTVVMRNYRGNLNACETQLSGGAMTNGISNLKLSAPGVGGDGKPNTGSVDLEVNLGAVAAGEKTCTGPAEANATSGVIPWFGGPDPVGRATFGVYKAPIIYMRENFGP